MDRNTLLAFMISMLIFSAWLSYEASRQVDVEPQAGAAAEQGFASSDRPEGVAEWASDPVDRPSSEGRTPPPAASPSVPARPGGASEEWSDSFENDLFRVEVANRGGGIRSWKLLDPRYTVGSGRVDEEPIDLVTRNSNSPPVFATPLEELGLGDLGQALFRVESASADRVVFVYGDEKTEVRKELRFDPQSYVLELELAITNRSDTTLKSDLGVLWPAAVAEGNDFRELSLIALANEDIEKEPVAGVGSPGFFDGILGGGSGGEVEVSRFRGDVEWAGVDARYFISALLPRDANAQVSFEPMVIGDLAATRVSFPDAEIGPGQTVVRQYRAYMGPKVAETLGEVGPHLERSIDLGYSWLEPLTLFFHWLLKLLYSFIPNYGVAIIITTIMVRLVTFPIMAKQMKSMEKMRVLQPRIKELQENYKEDRQRQSEEMMKLYKEEGANPLSGCFPMVLQFPVFIGLFYALQSTIELRHAHFALWITDLSAPEELFVIPGIEVPIRVLPLAMGASMVLQQRMTPMTGMDPAQARMMTTVMPIMMTVLFYQFPSGLVLYWFVSNLLGIAHQLIVRRKMED